MVDNEKIKNLFSWMEEKGITDIEIIDVSKLTPMVDYFMIGKIDVLLLRGLYLEISLKKYVNMENCKWILL